MKALLWSWFFLAGVTISLGQVTPANPTDFTKRNLGERGGSVSGGMTGTVRKVETVQYTAVSPLRGWTNLDGKTIQARLLAFSVPAEGTSGPIEVIRSGKIRFLIPNGKSPVDYPLKQLQDEDREEVERIAKAAAQGPPPAAENEESKSSE